MKSKLKKCFDTSFIRWNSKLLELVTDDFEVVVAVVIRASVIVIVVGVVVGTSLVDIWFTVVIGIFVVTSSAINSMFFN